MNETLTDPYTKVMHKRIESLKTQLEHKNAQIRELEWQINKMKRYGRTYSLNKWYTAMLEEDNMTLCRQYADLQFKFHDLAADHRRQAEILKHAK